MVLYFAAYNGLLRWFLIVIVEDFLTFRVSRMDAEIQLSGSFFVKVRTFAIVCGCVVAFGLVSLLRARPATQTKPARVPQVLTASLPSSNPQTGNSTSSAHPAEATAAVTVHPETPGRAIPARFLGLSYEAPVLAHHYFEVRNKAFRHLLANLGTGVLRFGGNSVEFTYWSRHGEIKEPKARATLHPKDLNRLFKFSKKTRWPVILGLNLGHYDPKMAAAEAVYAVKHGKSHLLALEIGNEPDLFMHNGLRPSTWGYADYLKQFKAYVKAIRARTPNAPISGPTTCCSAGKKWYPHFLAAENSQLMMATFHNYPMWGYRHLPRSSPHYPTVRRLLSPKLMNKVAMEVHKLVQGAREYHLPFRMAEANSDSHDAGVNGLSNVFGAALWGADYCFTLAEQGSVGVNFHGGFRPRIYFSPIVISHGRYTVQPLYYGMLLFHAATPGRLVPVTVRTHANVTAYGVLAPDGEVHLVLINKDERTPVDVQIAGLASYHHAAVLRLTAPSIKARTGITFGEHPVGPDGRWSPGPPQQVARNGEAFHLQLPAASAALVNFRR